MPAPQVVTAAFSRTTQNRVLVTYSINANTSDAQTNGNYSIPGLTVSSVSYNSSTFVATITTTGQTNTTSYTVTVSNVKDAATGTFTIGAPTNTFSFKQSNIVGASGSNLVIRATEMSVSHAHRFNRSISQPYAGTGGSAGSTVIIIPGGGFNKGFN